MKKFILPGFVTLFFLILASVYSFHVFAASSLDCDGVYRKEILSKEDPDLEKNQSYTVDKASLSKKDNDYCLLRLMSIEPGFEGDFENIVKITYVEDASDTSKFGESRGQKGEARTVLPLEHCVIEHIFIDHRGLYFADQLEDMARSGGLALKVGNLSTVLSFCGGVASADQSETKEAVDTPSTPKAKSISDWIKDNIFGGLIPQTESLLDNAPAETDLKPADPPPPPTKELFTGVVRELDGFADMQLQDGTWVELKIGDVIPYNAKVFTGYDATMEIRFSDHLIIIMRSLEDFSVQPWQTNPEAYRTELKLESGALRFKVEEGTMKTDMKVSTPNASASIVGTDFGVKYDKGSGVSIFEIYDGTIEIQDNAVHEKKILSSSYGSPIKRLEISKDGGIVEKIAVPKNQKGEKIPIWIYFVGVTVLIIGGLAFLKWRKRKSSGFRR